ncbi:hypothetical protein [Streptomyces sp. NPDC058424]|uniref:hypothetical protein n=1 Tax=Streptomyces sp. NPDC058424 TaxID=3346491 RepID=UPI003667DA51
MIGRRELLLSAYEVRSPYDMSALTSRYDAARFELRVTNRKLQMWDGTTQLWSHPWRTLRLTAEGKVLVVTDSVSRDLWGTSEVERQRCRSFPG